MQLLTEHWPFILAVGASIAGFMSFVANLLTIRKLDLEIEALARERERTPSRIHAPTAAEIGKYGAPAGGSFHALFVPLSPRLLGLGVIVGLAGVLASAFLGVRMAVYITCLPMLAAAFITRRAAIVYPSVVPKS
jgi:hypothetical protein